MSINKKAKKTNYQALQQVDAEIQSEKSNTLILGGVLIAMSSIGLLIFVISEKILHLKSITP